MSKRFVGGLNLIILLVSLNALCMHNNKLIKPSAYLKNAKKKEQPHKDVLLTCPLSASDFKRQSIVLQTNNSNQYSLIFNCDHQQPLITEYLLEGKSVGKLIQINDGITFQGNPYVACNFSLQIPYHAGSLTINTQGQCVFEKTINTYSARLTCKTLDFNDEFLSNNNLIIQADSCKTQAHVECSDLLFKGKEFEVMPKSSLSTQNSLTLMAQSRVLNNGSVTVGDTFYCASKLFDHRGILDVSHNCMMEKGDTFSSTASSQCYIKGDWKAFVDSLFLSGYFSVGNVHIVGKNFTTEESLQCIAENAYLEIEEDVVNAGEVKVLGLLDVTSNNIKTEQASCITADNANLTVTQAIDNQGTIGVKQHLSARAHYISNAGKITANTAKINADRYFYNQKSSTLSAKNNLTINTPVYLNRLALTQAQHLTINSALGFNAWGVYSAKNLNINSLIPLHAGLFLPKFDSFAEICSPENLWGFGWALGESLFIKNIPTWGLLYTALKNIKVTYHQGEAFCGEVSSLYKQTNRGASDVIPVLCSLKNMLTSGWQTYKLGKQSHHLFCGSPQPVTSQDLETTPKSESETEPSDFPFPDNYPPIESSPHFVTKVKNVALPVAVVAASLFVPITPATAAIAGIAWLYAKNIESASKPAASEPETAPKPSDPLADNMQGSEPAPTFINRAQNIALPIAAAGILFYAPIIPAIGTIATINWLYRQSIEPAPEPETAPEPSDPVVDNIQSLEPAPSFVDRAKDVAQQVASVAVSHYGPSITTTSLIDCNYGVAIGVNNNSTSLYHNNSGVSLYVNNTIETHCAENTGYLGGYNVNVKGVHDSSSFHNKGNIQAYDTLSVDTGDVHLNEKSQINSSTGSFKCKGEWQNHGKLKTEKCFVDSKGKAINTSDIEATQLLNVKAKDVAFTSASNVKTKDAIYKSEGNVSLDGTTEIEQGTVDADGTVKTIGKIGASRQLGIKAKDIVTEKLSHTSAPKMRLKATERIDNYGKLSGSNLFAHTKYVNNDGEITSDNKAHFKADRLFSNAGYITVENNLAIDALTLVNTLGCISAESIYTNSIVDVNLLGVYRGNNICQNSFFSYNKGILIPKFKSLQELKEVIEKDPLRFTKTFVFQFIPGASKVCSLLETTASAGKFVLKTAPMCFTEKGRSNLWNEGKAKYKSIEGSCKNMHERYAKNDLCVSDVVPVLCQAKNTVASTIQVGYEMTEAVQLVHQGGQQVWQGGKQAYQERKLRQLVEEQACQVGQQLYQDGEQVYQEEKLIQLVEQQASQAGKQLYKSGQQIYQGGQPISKAYQRGKLVQLVAQQACQVEQQPYQDGQRAYNIAQNYGNGKSDKTENGVQEQNTQHTMPIYDDCQKISKAYREGKLAPLIKQEAHQIKQQISQDVQQVCHKAYNTVQVYWNGKSDTKSSAPEQSFAPEQSTNNNLMCTIPIYEATKSLIGAGISTAASIVGPQFSKNTLVDIDDGLTLGVNGNSQSLYSQHGGISLFANTNSISTIWGTNTGFIGGSNVSVNAAQSYSSNGIMGTGNLSMTANDLDVAGGAFAFNNMSLTARRNAVLDREIQAKNVAVHAKNILIKDNASIDSHNTTNVIATEKVTNKGTIDGKQTVVRGNEIVLESGSKVLAHGNDATVDIKATQLLDAHKEAYVHSEGTTSVQSAGHAKIDGSITGNKTHVQANTLEVQKNAHISAKTQTTVVATEKLTNQGTIDGNHTILQGNKVILENGSKVLAHAGDGATAIVTKELTLQDGSHIAAATNYIDAQTIRGEKGNTITSSHGTFIKTNEINNQGNIDGTMLLNFTGNANQLERIGTVDHLAYSGTLENNIADQLADGHNTLIDVTQGGSVGISAQQQDVHLKEQHDMAHALWVKTEGAITCDKNLTSEKYTWLEAKGDVQHANVRSKGLTGLIGKNISSEGHVTREKNGENYKDTAETCKVSGYQVIIKTTGDVNYKGTDVHSGKGGTQLYIDGKLIADVLETQEYSKTEEYEFGTIRTKTLKNITTAEDLSIIHLPSSFTSDGVTSGYVGDTAELHGTMFASKGGTHIQGTFEDVPTYDVHIQTKETKNVRSGEVTEDTPSVTTHRKPITFNDESPTVLTSDNPISLHLAGTTPSITFNAPVVEVLVAKEKTQKVCRLDKIHGRLWEKGTQANSHDIVHDKPYSGTVNTNAQIIHVVDTKGASPITLNATGENPIIMRTVVEDVHEYKKKTLYSRPTPLLMNTAGLLLSLGTSSLGAPLGIGCKMALTGIQTFTWNAINNLVYCEGNYRDAAKNMVNPQALRLVIMAAFMSGATMGANNVLDKFIPPISPATKLVDRFVYTATRELTHGGLRLARDVALGIKPKDALKNNLKISTAGIVGMLLSGQIGQAYGEQKIGPCTHKLFHTGVGALQGAILDGKNGAIAGAIGAGVAELIADIASPKPPTLDDIFKLEAQLGRPLTQDEFTTTYNRELSQYLHKTHSIADASKIAAATVAGLAQQDMNIAHNTATNAIDNNFIVEVIVGAGYLYSAYQIHETYKEKGAEAAFEQLGIEIVLNVACQGAFKVAFKVGSKLYPSARAATNAALNNVPRLKHTLGSFTETLIVTGEKLATTGLDVAKKVANTKLVKQTLITAEKAANKAINAGKEASKQAKRAGKHARETANKISTAKDKIVKKAKDTIVENVAEGLVEHSVPGSVLIKAEEQAAKKAAKETARNLSRPPKKPLQLPKPAKPLQLPAPVAGEAVKETAAQTVATDISTAASKTIGKKAQQELTESQKHLENFAKKFFEESKTEIEALEKKFHQHEKINDKWLKLDMDHFFGMDVSWSKKGKAKIGGFHHDVGNKVVDANIFEFAEKVVHDNGCWKAKMFYKGDFVKDVTSFPSDWSREKVVSKIFEAHGNAVKDGIALQLNEQGKYCINGWTNEGIKIKMFITQNGHIKTVYPIFE